MTVKGQGDCQIFKRSLMAPIVRSYRPPKHSRDIGADVNGYQLRNSDDLEHLFPTIPSRAMSGHPERCMKAPLGCVTVSVNILGVSQDRDGPSP